MIHHSFIFIGHNILTIEGGVVFRMKMIVTFMILSVNVCSYNSRV